MKKQTLLYGLILIILSACQDNLLINEAGSSTVSIKVEDIYPSSVNFYAEGRSLSFENNWENRCGDAFTLLRELDAAGEKFDMVILDPPKLVPHKGALIRGSRGYQDLARLGFKLLHKGGVLCNFSCSGLMEMELFQKITASAALEAGVNGRIIARLEQSPDHPTVLSVPETFYLKGLVTVID